MTIGLLLAIQFKQVLEVESTAIIIAVVKQYTAIAIVVGLDCFSFEEQIDFSVALPPIATKESFVPSPKGSCSL